MSTMTDPLSLVLYPPIGITPETESVSVDLHGYLDQSEPVPLTQHASSVRGFSALGDRTPLIFDRDIDTRCPTPRMDRYTDAETGEIIERVHTYWSHYLGKHVDAPCDRNSCPACAVRHARRIAGAIYLSRPDYVLTLTQVGETYDLIRKRLTNFFVILRRTYPTIHYTWQVEWNPRDTGNHALCYLRLEDDLISVPVIDHARLRIGFGPVFEVDRIPQRTSVIYFAYQAKDLVNPERRESYLALNGRPSRQAIVHSSRGFYRDGVAGEKLSRSQAESLALRRSR
jgi:hypothetical protein